MPYGYTGKIAKVDLSRSRTVVEEHDERFYRRYLGGRGLVAHYLLAECSPGVDPLGEANQLIFAGGILTGTGLPGTARNSVGAKSPLTGGFGESEAGGYWGAELKAAGFDALVIKGKSPGPVYLWVHDGSVEVRDASHLWGTTTGEAEARVRRDLADTRVRVAAIGPGGENLVRFACIMNDLKHAYGRTGMGAVMGAKNLKAVAVRGRRRVPVADPDGVKAQARWVTEVRGKYCTALHDVGTAGEVIGLNTLGALPTRNFQEGVFEEAAAISGEAMRDTILVGRHGCYACPVKCKRVVKCVGRFEVDPAYGGPEYETIASLGSNCGIGDLEAIAKGNELCNAYSLDTISTGTAIAFCMECYERELVSRETLGGLELRFGDVEGMLEAIEQIARRRGIGEFLADGLYPAAERLGSEAVACLMHVKGQGMAMHDPRLKPGVGLGNCISPTGADHNQSIHDTGYYKEGPGIQRLRSFGILDPLPLSVLSTEKVRAFVYQHIWHAFLDAAGICFFAPYAGMESAGSSPDSYERAAGIVRCVTGWNSSLWELMKVGERIHCMSRLYNLREGLSADGDVLPERFFSPLPRGPLAGTRLDRSELNRMKVFFYKSMGWDGEGRPTPEKLAELGISSHSD